jgi:hypothetical protein
VASFAFSLGTRGSSLADLSLPIFHYCLLFVKIGGKTITTLNTSHLLAHYSGFMDGICFVIQFFGPEQFVYNTG